MRCLRSEQRPRSLKSSFQLRAAAKKDWSEIADLICVSTNFWYRSQGHSEIFRGGPQATSLFLEVYETLDPGCCIVAQHNDTGRLMGSCFYHPRPTHFSLGIMNVHPNYFGEGVASRILDSIIQKSVAAEKPLRLVSSGMNLDSFSLYTRAGFVPRQAYQVMFLEVPKDGMDVADPGRRNVREARLDDVPRLAELELEIAGISREKDYRFFMENEKGYWHTLVYESDNGNVDGFLVSISHPCSNMIGPGATRTAQQAASLLIEQLDCRRGTSPVFLVPVDCRPLVERAYSLGAKNCEIHFVQVLGDFQPIQGVVIPTFMPETG